MSQRKTIGTRWIAALGLSVGLLALPTFSRGQNQTTVFLDSGIGRMVYANSAKTTPLPIGDIIELGYYTNAPTTGTAAGAEFTGIFTALSGPMTVDSAFPNTTIGQGTASAGTYSFSLNYISGSATAGVGLPASGTPLSIRFYNSTSIATATAYNDVSSYAWAWNSPATPSAVVFTNLNDNLDWLGGASTAFFTSQPVPEPSTFAILAGGLGVVLWSVCRRRASGNT